MAWFFQNQLTFYLSSTTTEDDQCSFCWLNLNSNTVGRQYPLTWRHTLKKETAVDVRGPVSASTPAALAVLARAGVGLAQLPDWLVTDDVEKGRLRQVLVGWDTPGIATWLIHRVEHRQAARVRAFVDAMTLG